MYRVAVAQLRDRDGFAASTLGSAATRCGRGSTRRVPPPNRWSLGLPRSLCGFDGAARLGGYPPRRRQLVLALAGVREPGRPLLALSCGPVGIVGVLARASKLGELSSHGGIVAEVALGLRIGC